MHDCVIKGEELVLSGLDLGGIAYLIAIVYSADLSFSYLGHGKVSVDYL